MERIAINKLKKWKESPLRKPLIMRGARQVGKTWIVKKFAEIYYPNNWVYINFEEEKTLQSIFEDDFDIHRILTTIELRKGCEINESTLLIFDEIQVALRGVMSLKYFCENNRQQPIIAVGSLLGISMHTDDSFPVGKVDFLDLYPMSFREFLMANGKQKWIDIIDNKKWDLLVVIRDQIQMMLRQYYYVGGMPEVVDTYIRTGNMEEVRNVQNNILNAYVADFSKHAPSKEVSRIRMIWDSIVGQLSKENKKFLYNVLREGARAKEFELAIEWLVDAGLIYKVKRTKSGELPLNAFEDFGTFKLFMLDIGLLCALAKVSSTILTEDDSLFSTFKGALTEQFVCQQLWNSVDLLYYWSAENSRGEIDFLVQKDQKVIPIEVKAEENLKAKSLRFFVGKYKGLHGIRFSMADYREQDWMTNIPLYSVLG